MRVNPDEAVAYGAAVLGRMLAENKTDNLIDVTPISFGIGVSDGSMSIIIPRGTIIPAKITGTYETTVDYQT